MGTTQSFRTETKNIPTGTQLRKSKSARRKALNGVLNTQTQQWCQTFVTFCSPLSRPCQVLVHSTYTSSRPLHANTPHSTRTPRRDRAFSRRTFSFYSPNSATTTPNPSLSLSPSLHACSSLLSKRAYSQSLKLVQQFSTFPK